MTKDMPRLAVTIGSGLITMGALTYFVSGMASFTALIPSAFGLVLLALALYAKRTGNVKHAMHGAAVVALLGLLGSADGLAGTWQVIAGEAVERPMAAGSKTVMFFATGYFLVACIQSFREARRSR